MNAEAQPPEILFNASHSLACLNRSQIIAVLNGQMPLYGIAGIYRGFTEEFLPTAQSRPKMWPSEGRPCHTIELRQSPTLGSIMTRSVTTGGSQSRVNFKDIRRA